MSSADLWEDNYPHGTPQGYDDGCRGGACPAGVRYGLSCKIAKAKRNGDVQYRRLVKAGESVPAIADALGLIGSEPSGAVAKKAPAPAAPKPQPTPATAKGGVSLAEAAAVVTKAAAAGQVSIRDAAETPTVAVPEKYIPAEGSPQAKGVWEQTAELLGTPTAADAGDAVEAPAPRRPVDHVKATKPAAPTAPAPSTPAPAPAPAPASGEIRAWALAKGYDVAATGKLPKRIVDHYWEQTGRLTLSDEVAKNLAANKPQALAAEEGDAAAPEGDTIDDATDTPESDEALAALREKLSGPRPEWGDVAAHVDVEAARNLAVRLEQELARSEEQRTADKAQHARSLRAADDVLGGVLEALGKGPDHDPIIAASAAIEETTQLVNDLMAEFSKRMELEERLTRRTAERDDAEKRARIAEKAVELALTKWGEERAAIEASTVLIHEQARTINTLSSHLAPQRWVLGDSAPDIDAKAFTGHLVEIPRGGAEIHGVPLQQDRQ